MNHRPKCKTKTQKLLKEKIGEKFCDFELGKKFIEHKKHKP